MIATRGEYLQIGDRWGFVETAGEGTPLLCIHSAGQSGVQWRSVAAELPRHGYRVLIVDLPGHGRSEPAAAGVIDDLGEYADWCLEVLERLSVERPYVVGCSIGGKIALDMATRDHAVSGVVAMAADAWNTRLSIRSLELSREDSSSPSRADRTYYGTLAACGREVPEERSKLIAAMHRREDPLVSTADLLAWSKHDLRLRLSSIVCPVRLVAGKDDFWIDVDDIHWAGEQIENAEVDLLNGVGHYPMEELDEFPELLAGWLENIPNIRKG